VVRALLPCPASKRLKGQGMSIVWSHSLDAIDWHELESLYRAAPLGTKLARDLQTVFHGSRYCCFARDAGALVAAGRALADGADCSYVCDIAVLPSHQGLGLGKEAVRRLVDQSSGHKKIILYAVPGKEGFYEKLGFLRMRTAMAIFKDPAAGIQRGHLSPPSTPTLPLPVSQPQLDHTIVPSRDNRAAAALLADLLGVPTAPSRFGPFIAVFVNDGLTLDFDQWETAPPLQHYCFRLDDAGFDRLLGKLKERGIAYRSTPLGPVDMAINTQHGGRILYWAEPDGHAWEVLTHSYARQD
jgi:GNAT superfamily N-acetyltransferase